MARPGLTGFFTLLVFCSAAADELIKASFQLKDMEELCFSARSRSDQSREATVCFQRHHDGLFFTFPDSIHVNLTYTSRDGSIKTIDSYGSCEAAGTCQQSSIQTTFPKSGSMLTEHMDWTNIQGMFTYDVNFDELNHLEYKYDSNLRSSDLNCSLMVIQKYVHSDNAGFEYAFEYKQGRSTEHELSLADDSQEKIREALHNMEVELKPKDFAWNLEKDAGVEFLGIGTSVRVEGSETKSRKKSLESIDVSRIVADFKEQLKEGGEETKALKVVVDPGQTISFHQMAVRCGKVVLRGKTVWVECFGEGCTDKSVVVENEDPIHLRNGDYFAEGEVYDNGAKDSNSGEVTQFSAVLYMATICTCIRHLLASI